LQPVEPRVLLIRRELHDPTLSTDSFRRLLKTWLFSEYYYIQCIGGIALYVLYKFTTY